LTLLTISTAGIPLLLWAGAIGWTATGGSWITIGMLAIIREVPLEVAGRVSGVVLSAFYVGLGLGPITFGFIVDVTDSYAVAWGTGAISYFLAAIVVLRWTKSLQRAAASRSVVDETEAPA
jgi:cyanate permease